MCIYYVYIYESVLFFSVGKSTSITSSRSSFFSATLRPLLLFFFAFFHMMLFVFRVLKLFRSFFSLPSLFLVSLSLSPALFWHSVKYIMAKKGRAARILNTLHKVNGTKQSEALRRRERKRPSKEFGGGKGGSETTNNSSTTSSSEWQKKRQKQRDLKHAKEQHSGEMSALIFGDGDFSFSVGLVTLANGDGSNVIATGLEKRVDEKTRDLVECLLDSGARVCHGVDVSQKLDEDVLFGSNTTTTTDKSKKNKKMDRVYFNFPDCGFGAMASLAPTRIANERLLEHVFARSSEHLKVKGELRVTCFDDAHAAAMPTEACEKLAFVKERERFRLKAKIPFEWREYPGYEYKKTVLECEETEDDEEEDDNEEEEEHHFDAEGKEATTLVFEYLGNSSSST